MITKRDALKFIGLAPAAAPIAAASMVDMIKQPSMLSYAGTAMGTMKDNYPKEAVESESDRWLSELKWAKEALTRAKSDEFDSYDRNEVSSEYMAAFYVDNLRSVSKPVKLQMMRKEKRRIEQARAITAAEKAISFAKQKLGILGVLFD